MRNSTLVSSSASFNLADLVHRASRTHGHQAAVVAANRTTSWAELERLVRAVAGGLATRITPGDRVVLMAGNSIEFVMTYWGALRAGLVLVPINPAASVAAVKQVVDDVDARLLICDPDAASVARVAVAGTPTAVVEFGTDDWLRLTVGSTPPPPSATDPESTALLSYTSGAWEQPRLVALSHRSLMANLQQLSRISDPPVIGDEDVVGIAWPLFHVFALTMGVGLSALGGHSIVLLPNDDPKKSLRLLYELPTTLVVASPRQLDTWAGVDQFAVAFRGIRAVITASAPVPRRAASRYAGEDITIWTCYSLTQAAGVVASTLGQSLPRTGSVGRPLPGVSVSVRDAQGDPVVDGDPGQIWIHGPNLFSSYWAESDDDRDESGWFPTGDVGVDDGSGDLVLVDRHAEVVIVEGFTVYPREIETVLQRLPDVRDVMVYRQRAEDGTTQLAASVVLNDGSSLTPEDVLAFARESLARFKVPTAVDFVSDLPHSIVGKIVKVRGDH